MLQRAVETVVKALLAERRGRPLGLLVGAPVGFVCGSVLGTLTFVLLGAVVVPPYNFVRQYLLSGEAWTAEEWEATIVMAASFGVFFGVLLGGYRGAIAGYEAGAGPRHVGKTGVTGI